jgi:hypothetical protein
MDDDEWTTTRVHRVMLDLAKVGWIEIVSVDPDGEPRFRITPEGFAHIDKVLRGEEDAE